MKYILVAMDYVLKLVEVVSLPNNEGRSITKFLKNFFFLNFPLYVISLVMVGSTSIIIFLKLC